MESLSMLGLSGQARAPTQALESGALIGPPGSTAAPWKVSAPAAFPSELRAAFAAALQQLLGGVAPRQASGGTIPGGLAATLVTEEDVPPENGAGRLEEGEDGANAARRSRARRDAPAVNPVDPGGGAALLPMPPDLIEEAAAEIPAPEPGGAGAGDEMTVAAVLPSATTDAPAETMAMAVVPAPSGGDATVALAMPDAALSPPIEAPPLTSAEADVAPEPRDPSSDVPVRSDAPSDEPREAKGATTGSTLASQAEPDPTGDHEAAAAAAGPPPRHVQADEAPPRAESHSGILVPRPEDAAPPAADAGTKTGGVEPPADIEHTAPGEPVSARGPEARSAGLTNASATARPAESEAPPQWSPAAGRDAGIERPGRGRQDAPHEGTPAALAGGARATVVHWLQGAEVVDEGEAAQQAGRLLLSSLVDDIRRLTFVGQSRAVLQLQPPELGKLSIHLNVGDDGLAVEMVVETEAVRAIVESTLDQLRSSLAQQGLATSGVFVQVGQSAHRDAEAWQARRGHEARGKPATGVPTEVSAPPPQARAVGYGSTVDYRI